MSIDANLRDNPIERAMLSVRYRTQQAVSPWVRRALARSTVRASGGRRFVSLTGSHAARMLQRSAAFLEYGTSLRTRLGSLEPRLINRFSSSISDRFMPLATKHASKSTYGQTLQPIDMPLAEGASMSDAVDSGAEQNLMTQYPAQYGLSDSASAEPAIQREFESTPPVAPAIQRSVESEQFRPRTFQEMSDLLESRLAARRGEGQARPAVSRVPPPSTSSIRRVARVEEFDPLAMAARNAEREPPVSGEPAPEEPPAVGGPSIQRSPEAAPPPASAYDISQDLPSVRNDFLGPNGEYSPLQRIRQARAAQLQRAQAASPRSTSRPAPEPPAARTKPAVTDTGKPPLARPARQTIQRRVTEITPPSTETAAPPGDSAEPTALEDEPGTPNRPATGPVTVGPDISRSTADASTPRPVEAPAPHAARPSPRPDAVREEGEISSIERSMLKEVDRPSLRRAPETAPAQTSPQGAGDRGVEPVRVTSEEQPEAIQRGQDVAGRQPESEPMSAGRASPHTAGAATPDVSASFAEHIISRAASHGQLPLTQRLEPAPKVQRQTDTAGEHPAAAPQAIDTRSGGEIHPPEQPAPPPQVTVEDSAASQMTAVQRSAERPVVPIDDAASAPHRRASRIAAAVQEQGEPAAPQPVQRSATAYPPRPPALQRRHAQRARTPLVDTLKPPHTVLPQVQSSLAMQSDRAIMPRAMGNDFTTYRSNAPGIERISSDAAAAMPLLQRSMESGRSRIAESSLPERRVEITRRVESPAEEQFVMRAPKTNSGGTEPKKVESDSTVTDSSSTGSAPAAKSPALPEVPDINQLARDVLPLIKRMLAVERERIRGR